MSLLVREGRDQRMVVAECLKSPSLTFFQFASVNQYVYVKVSYSLMVGLDLNAQAASIIMKQAPFSLMTVRWAQ